MRFSLLALVGLMALGSNLGVQARAPLNDLALSQPVARHAQNSVGEALIPEDERLKGRSPAAPPLKPAGRPPTNGPEHAPPPRPGGNGNGNGKNGDKDGQPPTRLDGKPKDKPDRVCIKPTKRSRFRFFRRTEWTHADAANPQKYVEWINENKEHFKDFDPKKAIFYIEGLEEERPGAANTNGKEMAKRFIAANPGQGYVMWEDIFGKKWYDDFKISTYPIDGPDYKEAVSRGFAMWAERAMVFNLDAGKFLLFF
jgi:hypothetical protein